MLIEPFLRRLVVVRRHRQQPIRPEPFAFTSELYDMSGVVASRASDHRDATASMFDTDLNYATVLGIAERGTLAGRAARHQKIDSAFDLEIDEPAQYVFVQRQIFLERRYHCRPAAFQI